MQEASINQIKLLRKLAQKKHREKTQLFIIEGERAVGQILEHKFLHIEAVFFDKSKVDSYEDKEYGFLLDHKILVEISDTESPQGVLAICRMPKPFSLSEIQKINSGTIVACDAIQDPGNLGTILRTASWFGSSAILLGRGTVDLFNPKVVRSTVGSTGTLPFLSGNLAKLLAPLEQSGWNTLLLDGNTGAIPINKILTQKKTILVVGNEANGISKELIIKERTRVLIPSKSTDKSVESLNAAVALGIGLWSVNN